MSVELRARAWQSVFASAVALDSPGHISLSVEWSGDTEDQLQLSGIPGGWHLFIVSVESLWANGMGH